MKNIKIMAVLLSLVVNPTFGNFFIFHPGKHKIKPSPKPDHHAFISPTGSPITQSADLVFKETSQIDFQLLAENNLKAGKNNSNTIVASYYIRVKKPTRLGIRWTRQSGLTNGGRIVLSGKEDSMHKIVLYLPTLASGNFLEIWDNKGWAVSQYRVAELNGTINFYKDQTVQADIYTLSMDASAFIS
ncbi:hypothetical protein [Pantoea agglomerans]|uniref:hypothetical protein n=1 Tax=Enterobacter agglomerans TaxID=549 RepID=UPI0013BEF88B|nr:hypothetical protein [Pantoea agglomerans]NEH20677.1 hypothetical protein [Pantoea agglomerans]